MFMRPQLCAVNVQRTPHEFSFKLQNKPPYVYLRKLRLWWIRMLVWSYTHRQWQGQTAVQINPKYNVGPFASSSGRVLGSVHKTAAVSSWSFHVSPLKPIQISLLVKYISLVFSEAVCSLWSEEKLWTSWICTVSFSALSCGGSSVHWHLSSFIARAVRPHSFSPYLPAFNFPGLEPSPSSPIHHHVLRPFLTLWIIVWDGKVEAVTSRAL